MKKLILFVIAFVFSITLFSSCTHFIFSRCHMKPEAGPCKAAFERYYYNPETKKCESFIWGGCQGKVPFETLEECKSKCNCE